MRQLRFATVGSVDDGKSTLIGRLLYDSKSIFEDQLEHVEAVSKRRGDDYVDLSLLTDGLRAEREQGITIDVAHRRPVFVRDGMLMAVTEFLPPDEGAQVTEETVRFRTVGDATCTAAIASVARTVDEVIAETAVARVTERGATRADDRVSEAGMEDRKRQGYF